jgi:hypothetical protein
VIPLHSPPAVHFPHDFVHIPKHHFSSSAKAEARGGGFIQMTGALALEAEAGQHIGRRLQPASEA